MPIRTVAASLTVRIGVLLAMGSALGGCASNGAAGSGSCACGIVWNCTDILPSLAVFGLEMCGIEISRRTYTAAARALLPAIKDAQLMSAA